MGVTVRVVRLPHAEGLPLPSFASKDAAGWICLRPWKPEKKSHSNQGMGSLYRRGLTLQLPEGYEAQVRPRSALR